MSQHSGDHQAAARNHAEFVIVAVVKIGIGQDLSLIHIFARRSVPRCAGAAAGWRPLRSELDVYKRQKLTYHIQMKRVILRKLVMGIADANLEVDGRTIYTGKDLRVGLFTSTDGF